MNDWKTLCPVCNDVVAFTPVVTDGRCPRCAAEGRKLPPPVESLAVAVFCADVEADLIAQRDIGVPIPCKAIVMARDRAAMLDYSTNMRVSECADLLVTLARLK